MAGYSYPNVKQQLSDSIDAVPVLRLARDA